MKNKEILLKRVTAFFIDIVIISIIIELAINFKIIKLNDKKINSYEDKLYEKIESFNNDEITIQEFKNEYITISYQLIMLRNKLVIFELIICFLYFVILQWKLNGQTIGKKLLKIKVETTDNSCPAFSSFFFRALIINNLFLYTMEILGRYYLNDVSNYYLILTITLSIRVIILVSGFVSIIRKDNRTIYDLLTNTRVVKV